MKIHHDKWKECCDYIWEGGDLPPTNSVVYVPMDWIYEFFSLIESTANKYVLVSANSDYGLTHQDKEPVESDMRKFFNMVDTNGLKYNSISFASRCDVGMCRITDKYSIKMYSWTNRTFNKIPDNIVKWFGSNINIDEDRIVHIPLGVPEWSIDKLEKTVKTKFSVYLNFQNNTLERVQLKNAFSHFPDVIIEDNVSHDAYIQRLKECPFIIAPPGNGYDCFRTMEALYCGSIPVVVDDVWSSAYNQLPVLKTDSYLAVYGHLKNIWQESGEKLDLDIDSPLMSMVEWANQIQDARVLLNV